MSSQYIFIEHLYCGFIKLCTMGTQMDIHLYIMKKRYLKDIRSEGGKGRCIFNSNLMKGWVVLTKRDYILPVLSEIQYSQKVKIREVYTLERRLFANEIYKIFNLNLCCQLLTFCRLSCAIHHPSLKKRKLAVPWHYNLNVKGWEGLSVEVQGMKKMIRDSGSCTFSNNFLKHSHIKSFIICFKNWWFRAFNVYAKLCITYSLCVRIFQPACPLRSVRVEQYLRKWHTATSVTGSHERVSSPWLLFAVRPRAAHRCKALIKEVPSGWLTWFVFCFCSATTGCTSGGSYSGSEGRGFVWLPGPQPPRGHHEEGRRLNSAQFHQQGEFLSNLFPTKKVVLPYSTLPTLPHNPYFGQPTFFPSLSLLNNHHLWHSIFPPEMMKDPVHTFGDYNANYG